MNKLDMKCELCQQTLKLESENDMLALLSTEKFIAEHEKCREIMRLKASEPTEKG